MSADYVTRDGVPADVSLVFSAYTAQLLDSAPLCVVRNHASGVARRCATAVAERIIQRSACRVACAIDDANLCMGFALAEPENGLLHCIYVKVAYRGFGIGRALFAHFPECRDATLWTRAAETLGPRAGCRSTPSKLWTEDLIANDESTKRPAVVIALHPLQSRRLR